MADEKAGPDELFVCLACGKTSVTKYGFEGEAMPGWDESCMMNSEKFPKSRLVYSSSGLVVSVRD